MAGKVRRSSAGIVVAPTCVVFETPRGRVGIQPWIATAQDASRLIAGEPSAEENQASPQDAEWPAADPSESALRPAAYWPEELLASPGELILVGARRADPTLVQAWRDLARHGESLGYDRLPQLASRLADALESRLHQARWQAAVAVQHVCCLALLLRLAEDRAA